MTAHMGGPVLLEGVLKDFAWGRPDAMQPWTGMRSGGPEAELWFGTHPGGRSPARTADGSPAEGVEDGVLSAPLLVKLLAARTPLSLQVHPDHRGIAAIRAAGRGDLLADDEAKAELLLALEPFDVLAGLRPVAEGVGLLRALGRDSEAALLEDGRVAECLAVLAGPERRAVSDEEFGRAMALLPPQERTILAQVHASFPGDPGLAVALLMHARTLAPGEALFVDAGVIHAYVRGLGVEVMASGDNVLRLGLTGKQVAADAAAASLRPDLQPVHLTGAGTDGAGATFDADRAPFIVRVPGRPLSVGEGSTVLVLSGRARLRHPDGDSVPVACGRAALVHAPGWVLDPEGHVVVATPRAASAAA